MLDTGGQYCHLTTRKIRELGVYSEIRPSETPASELRGVKGIVISGGPASVYEEGSPQVDPAIFELDAAVLGICYGQQLIAWHLGGVVRKGSKGEYGLAYLDTLADAPIFRGIGGRQQIWMSHPDTVTPAPAGSEILGSTDTSEDSPTTAPSGPRPRCCFMARMCRPPQGVRLGRVKLSKRSLTGAGPRFIALARPGGLEPPTVGFKFWRRL